MPKNNIEILFMNIDTQYDFMRDDSYYRGKLPIPDAEKIEQNLERLTKLARKKGIRIINTADWHTLEDKELSNEPDYKETFPKHCIINTKGAEFIPATYPINPYVIDWRDETFDSQRILDTKEIVLRKNNFDVFRGNPYAEEILKFLDPKRVVVYGVSSNVCVDRTIQGLLNLIRGIKIYVPTDCVKGLPNLSSPIKRWEREGIRLTTKQGIYELIGA